MKSPKYHAWIVLLSVLLLGCTELADLIRNGTRYTVTFDLNYAGAPEPSTQLVNYGQKVVEPKIPTRAGYSFTGWFEERTDYLFDFANHKIAQDLTLYARWGTPATSKVTFDLNYAGAPEPTVQVVNYGQKVVEPKNPTRAGYSFAGWFKKGTTNLFDFTNDKIARDLTLSAKWGPPAADLFSQFFHDGHNYYIVKTRESWWDAAAYAKKYAGHLVHINSDEEQGKISAALGKLSRHFGKPAGTGYSDTHYMHRLYLWIGATDKAQEGTWVWDGDNDGKNTQPLGSEITNGWKHWRILTGWRNPTGAYEQWRKTVYGSVVDRWEPNNLHPPGGQDFAAIRPVLPWQYHWSDLRGWHRLYFIVELP